MTKNMFEAIHYPGQSQFTVLTPQGESVLSYCLNGSDIDFDSTFVCPEDRGSRVGINLVKAGVSWARNNGFNISASCWYVARYLDKHPR